MLFCFVQVQDDDLRRFLFLAVFGIELCLGTEELLYGQDERAKEHKKADEFESILGRPVHSMYGYYLLFILRYGTLLLLFVAVYCICYLLGACAWRWGHS